MVGSYYTSPIVFNKLRLGYGNSVIKGCPNGLGGPGGNGYILVFWKIRILKII